MFSKRGGGHESCKQCYFHLCCTFIQGQLVKRKKNNIYTTEIFFNSVSISKHD